MPIRERIIVLNDRTCDISSLNMEMIYDPSPGKSLPMLDSQPQFLVLWKDFVSHTTVFQSIFKVPVILC